MSIKLTLILTGATMLLIGVPFRIYIERKIDSKGQFKDFSEKDKYIYRQWKQFGNTLIYGGLLCFILGITK